MQFQKSFIKILTAAAALWCASSTATVILFDVNDIGTNNTQGSWTAANLNGVNNVLFTSVGGATLDDRDRGASNTNSGDSANNEMWRDFVFARNTSAQESGMDVSIDGLLASTYYDVRLWAFDDSSNGGRNMTWNGQALNIPTNGDPASLNDQMVSFSAMTNVLGVLTLEGRIGSPVGDCCNVFVNGFELTAKEVPVPAPATVALLGLGLAGLGLSRRRKLSV
jgi:hypothetical protein